MLNLRCADPMRKRPKSPMGRGMAVATNHGHAWQCPALFRANNMHNALTHIRNGVIVYPEILGVFIKCLNLNAAFLIHPTFQTIRCGGDVVIWHSDGFLWRTHRAPCHAQTLEGLRACHLMHKVAINIQKAGAILSLMDEMGIPDFVIKGFSCGHVFTPYGRLDQGSQFASQGRQTPPVARGTPEKAPRQARAIIHVKHPCHMGHLLRLRLRRKR